MNKEYDDLLNAPKVKSTKEAETDIIKALEHRRLGIQSKKSNVSSYDLQVSAEDVLVRKQFREMRCEMPGTPRSTFLMVFSPDGTKVASTHGNHNIYVTDIRTGKNIKTLVGHPRTPWCIAFHPTSNQILASGCLGGQVRIWDLSGGSEVWTSDTETVIASIAFHPDDRLLVIATYNELYFWDWSKPEPFMHVATGSIKEKVRYVAFDKLGHKLITGISNSPQTRWERVRAPVPVPRQADRAASPYRRRITPRLITTIPTTTSSPQSTQRNVNREPLSAVPERERRITACYRNLVREYELLVHRYLQIYRPPTMIDQGTDPMEIDLSTIANGTHSSTRMCPNPINLTTTSTNNLSMPGPSGINTQRPSTSGVENVTSHTGGPNIKRMRLISTIGTQTTTTTTTTLSRESLSRRNVYDGHSSTPNIQTVCASTSWNPIDLSRCSTTVSETTTNNNPYTNRPATSSTQNNASDTNGNNSQRENLNVSMATRESISATQAYETTPSIPSDMLLLTPSEICSLRRNMRNIRSTQTQSTDISDAVQNNESTNAPSTSGTHNRNERRNSAPASTISEDQTDNTQSLRRGDSEESLIMNTNSLQQNLNLIDGVKKGTPTIIIETAPPQNCTSQFQTSSTSKLVVIRSSTNQNSTQSTTISQAQNPRRLLIISTSLGTQTSGDNNQQPNENTDNFKMRIRCSNLSSNSQNQNTASLLKKREDILEQIKSLVQNQNEDSSNRPSTSSQSREFPNRNNLTNLLEGAEKIFSKYLLSKRVADRRTELNQSQPLSSPSTSTEHVCSGEHNIQNNVKPTGLTDFASNSTVVPPETKNPAGKFYEPRKRVYPGFSKKSRRPVLDSSSDSSSSDEDDRSKRHICSSRFPLHSKHFHLNTAANSKSVQSKVPASTSIRNTLQATQGNSHILPNTSNTRKPLNFNAELELLVTDLLASTDDGNVENTSSTSTSHNVCTTVTSENNDRICSTCGGSIEDRCSTQPMNHNKSNQSNVDTCARTNSDACPRSTVNINTRTTNTTVYTSPGHPRRRFFSHRLSAFYPTRIQNLRPHSRLRRSTSYLSPGMRNRLRTLNTLHSNNRLPFHVDEVVNYSERVNSEEEIQEQPEFHPFDPPPEFATINPENIGIGNMYSNIVQELESSLNDVRNIRASNRLGETSDMLSSFSGRLESIMNQSNAILRNLRTSLDTLTPSDQNVPYAANYDQGQQTSRASEPQFLFNDRNFFLREQRNNSTNENTFIADSSELLDSTAPHDDLFSNHNAIATDHTYPLNSRNSQTNTNNMTPLMASLHLTVSHIQRQARLLRQQVESIERIDRAMLEVAQLQMMRQLFVEIQRYFRGVPGGENRNAVSSVRQMMAGTRISDSSPYDSPNEETSTENQNSPAEAGPSTSNVSAVNENQNSTAPSRTQCRKTFPRCIFFMQRNSRRSSGGNILQRRSLSRERMMRRYLPRRTFTYRSLFPPIDLTINRNTIPASQVSSETLLSRTRRLEHFLMEHGRYIGRVVESRSTGPVPTDKDEYRMMLRLNLCRAHMNNILGQSEINNPNIRRQTSSVTADGVSRYGARDILTSAAETLTRFIESGANNTPSIRSLLWDVIDLSLLLSEILLLQIVDSIPPPTGMNLDPERESLSARIDQMCSRMLQSRLSGHSQQLTRSLRLTRLAVRHASRALDQTYTARRNAMLPSGNDRDQRRELLEEINNCLRNIRRHHTLPRQSTVGSINSSENLSMREWYRTIHGLISRYSIYPSLNDDRLPVNDQRPNDEQPSTSATNINNETGEETEPRPESTTRTSNVQQGSSDDDNEPVWYNNNIPRERARPLYRTNNVYLLNNEDSSSSSSRNRPWNIPTVQVNDVPISSWHPRFIANRQRLSERLSELRTYPVGGLFRPRFLHPLYAGVNPFDADLDDPAREQIYDSDIISTVNPNHRIQVWEFSTGIIPNINNALKNVVVNECKIHNDASVDIATDGCILVTLLPSGGYLNVTNRLGVYSLDWESLGQCLYVATFEQNAVSVSLSPLSRHLVVGLASRRVSIMPSDNWTMARIFMLDDKPEPYTQLSSVREVEQSRDPNHMSVNCIRWLPVSGQGLVYATNTGHLRVLA